MEALRNLGQTWGEPSLEGTISRRQVNCTQRAYRKIGRVGTMKVAPNTHTECLKNKSSRVLYHAVFAPLPPPSLRLHHPIGFQGGPLPGEGGESEKDSQQPLPVSRQAAARQDKSHI